MVKYPMIHPVFEDWRGKFTVKVCISEFISVYLKYCSQYSKSFAEYFLAAEGDMVEL